MSIFFPTITLTIRAPPSFASQCGDSNGFFVKKYVKNFKKYKLKMSKKFFKNSKTDGPSPLLRQFRANPMLNLELTDLGQHIIEFAQDQQGSRYC